MAHHPQYDPSDLLILKTYHQDHAAVNVVVHSLKDESAIAEVHHYRRLMME